MMRVFKPIGMVLGMVLLASAPASAQETPGSAIERSLELVERGNKPEAMRWARIAAELCADPAADPRECYVVLGMAAELAGQMFDTETAAQWAGASVAAAETMTGADSLPAALALSDQATRLAANYHFADAAAAGTRGLRIFAQVRGPAHPQTNTARLALADVLYEQGRLDEAEGHYRTALEYARQQSGAQSFAAALALNRLARVLFGQERFSEASELLRQSMEAQRGDAPIQSIGFHTAQLNLGLALMKMGDPEAGEPLIRAAVDSGQLDIDPQSEFAGNSALARVMLANGRAEEAYDEAERNLARARRRMGEGHADVGRYTMLLGRVAAARGQRGEAAELFERGAAILLSTVGAEHPDTIDALHDLARQLSVVAGMEERATTLYQQAMAAAIASAARGAIDPLRAQALYGRRALFGDFLDHLYAHSPDAAADGFAAMQWAMTTEGSLAVSRIAARRAGNSDAAGLLEAEQARLAADHTATAAAYAALALDPASDGEVRAKLAGRIAALEAELARVGQGIAASDPVYFELSRARVAALAQVQAALQADEAVLLVLPQAGGGHVLLVRRESAVWHRSAQLDETVVGQQVTALRRSAQDDVLYGEEAFDLAASRALYDAIFTPLAGNLDGVTRLHIRADGALGSLPFAMLAAPGGAESAWLADRFALESLPSLTAFARNRAASHTGQDAVGGVALAGIGAPILSGQRGAVRGAAAPSYSQAFTPLHDSELGASPFPLADPEFLSAMEPLPGAEAELMQIGQVFGAERTMLWIGADATEPVVRGDADISRAGILVFSTHGLLARQSLVGEPGLVLTPPAQAGRSAQNDGFLGASEVAQMQLAARLVLLSACNTGSADGRGAASGLSGLARAFMAAGSGQVVASHWQVSDAATAALMTEFTRLIEAEPAAPVAALLARAMAHVRAQPQWRSPGYWAAFAVYGGGSE